MQPPVDTNHTEDFFLHFNIGKSRFLIPLRDVQEVCDFTAPRPYPVHCRGYLGAINLRGNVVPVLSMAGYLETPLQEQGLLKNLDHQNRLILVRWDDNQRFCILATQIRKVSVAVAATSNTSVLSIDGFPVRLLEKQEFTKLLSGEKW